METDITIFTTVFVFVMGLAIGSFLNVVIDRVSNSESINGRSHCDYCKRTLQWYDLVPVFSFLSTLGTCRYCHKRLSVQYPLVELLCATGFSASLFFNGFVLDIELLKMMIIVACALVIVATDFKWQIILDEVLLVLMFTAFWFNASSLMLHFASGLVFALPFFLIHFLSGGKAMGFADVKLVFVMGLLLTVPEMFLGLYAAFLTGGAVSVILLISKAKHLKSKIAFGPFLAVGLLIAMWL